MSEIRNASSPRSLSKARQARARFATLAVEHLLNERFVMQIESAPEAISNVTSPVSQLEEHVLSLRVSEISMRDRILSELRKPEFTQVWKAAGHRNLREYCEQTLSYGALETREILVKIGHILTRDSMMSDDAAANDRIKRLISWRSRTALEERQPAYRILSNRTLLAVAHANPPDLEALERISGIGHVKVRNFGAAILKTLA